MQGFISNILSRTRSLLMFFVLLLAVGYLSYQVIPKESDPDVELAFIWVSLTHHGISPEDAERLLIRPMEDELKSITGVKEMSSKSREGGGYVELEFIAGFDSSKALASVRDKVSIAKAKLPSGAEEPVVNEVTMANEQSVLDITLSGGGSERGLIFLARELKDELEGLSEILEVDIAGNRTDMVEILVDPLLMESYGLKQSEIFNLVSRNNKLVSAGTLDSGKGRFAIKVPSVFDGVEDLLVLPVKVEGQRIITFADVAQIRRSFKDANSIARLNGERAVVLEIKKRTGENIIFTVDKVRAILEKSKSKWPNNISVSFSGDSSKKVKDMLSDLQNNVISAVLFVFLIIVCALGFRSAVLVGLAIPGAFLTGILALYLSGFTINVVVLFGLIMSVGMLVDGAIVVVEFADRKMSEGIGKKEAFSMASQRMAWPIVASTATTLAAFAPLLFWPGMMGQYMKFLPLTLIFVLSASLLMALVFIPALGGVIGKQKIISKKEQEQLNIAESGDLLTLRGLSGLYVRTLSKALKSPFKILFITLLLSVTIFVGYAKSGLGVEFFPESEARGVNLTVKSHGDLSILEKDTVMRTVEGRLFGIKGIKTIYTRTGGSERIGVIKVQFYDWDKRRKAIEIIQDMKEATSSIAGVQVIIQKHNSGPGSGKKIKLELSSKYPKLIIDAVAKIDMAMAESGYIENIQNDLTRNGIEWHLNIDRAQASKYGADATLVGQTVQMVTNGIKIGEYRPDDVDDELDIRVRYPVDYRNLSHLDQLKVNTINGLVPTSLFMERVPARKVVSIQRVDSKRVNRISGELIDGIQLDSALPELEQTLLGLGIDPRVNVEFRGSNEEQDESSDFLKKAFTVALFVMGIILVTQFNSFYQAGLILSAVVFSTAGVFLAMIIGQMPFGIVMGGIGVISLAGIVVNNNIVLIDTFNQLRGRGLSPTEAMLRTGAQRLRPVLLTTTTTMLGLMPMVFGMNLDFFERTVTFGAPSTQWWVGLATAVSGGLLFATMLTLILTPCLLVWRESRKL